MKKPGNHLKGFSGHIERERRKYPRYDTEMKVYIQLKYDVKTRVKFRVMTAGRKVEVAHKYSGLSKNVSAEGICFAAKKKLKKGDLLFIEVYEPKVKGPVVMEGVVRWSRKLPLIAGKKDMYSTGVLLISVNGRSIADSIHFDRKYNVIWSAVLEALFGNFASTLKKGGR
jgi:hypothetical protein